ncbi:MAG: hypothetical protein SWY16_02265 [Cyanobacteriota bacterium]|nr:hypothetical protein [Cyanobacteriota bacterium]
MNESSQIGYPTLALFLYDWREQLDRTEEAIGQNRHRFWRKIESALDKDYEELDESDLRLLAELAAREQPEASEVMLAEKSTDSTQSDVVQIGDTYVLRMISPGEDETGSELGMTSLVRLPLLKKEIVARIDRRSDRGGDPKPHQYGSIGQTWLLWGQLPGNHPQLIHVAKECYAHLSPDRTWVEKEIGQGRFFGASVYEMWYPPTDWTNLDLENWHQVVFLFPPRQPTDTIQNTMTQLYPELTHLFCYRHKVLRAYLDSRALEKQLTRDYLEIERIEAKVRSHLKTENRTRENLERIFLKLLDISSRYSKNLDCFEYHEKLIELNLSNYTKRLDKLAGLDGESQLEFLYKFASMAVENYQLKITAEYSKFKLGLTPLKNTIASLQYLLEKPLILADRTLENQPELKRDFLVWAIIAMGAGIAASNGIWLVTALGQTFGNWVLVLGASLSFPIGVGVGLLVLRWLKRR